MKRFRLHGGRLLMLLIIMALLPWEVQAFQFDLGESDLQIRFDNTIKYSAAFRLKEQSNTLVADINLDDGDRNFDTGIVSNRFDWFGELDATLPFGGIRISGQAWYDFVYNESNDNDSPLTSNAIISGIHDEFTEDTRDLHGRKAELMDAFAYLNLEPGPFSITLRAGRHALVYGETLFYGNNGIADAQGPVDAIKALTVPSIEFKEIGRPVEQVSLMAQLTPELTVGGYYQWKWHETVIPASGSYLSNADAFGEGAESMLLAPGFGIIRASALEPDDSGQFGVMLKYSLHNLGIDVGLYAARYHAKAPSGAYLDPVVTMTYRLVYAEDIDTYGISATGSVGNLNLATELSYRDNAILASDPQINVGQAVRDDSLLAFGQTFHANLSGIYALQANPLFKHGGNLLFELAYNNRLEIDKNPSALAHNTTKDAWALRMVFEPAFYQLLDGLDMTVPIGFSWNFSGRSSAVIGFGPDGAGDLSIGANFIYLNNWKFGISFIKYWGSENTLTAPANSPAPELSFDQTLADRDFISLYFKRTF